MIFEIFKDRKQQFRFRIKARNGRIIAQSEGYKMKRSIVRLIGNIEVIILDGRMLNVKDLTK